MPKKRKGGSCCKKKAIGGRRRKRGGSAFTDFFTRTIPNAAKSTGNFIKDQHILSKIVGLAGLIPHPAAKVGAILGSAGLRQAGLGRRRRGGSMRSMLEAAKKQKLASQGLALIDHPDAKKAAALAKMMGYGHNGQMGGLNALQGRLFLV